MTPRTHDVVWALRTRKVVMNATGIVMDRHAIDRTSALKVLVRVSRASRMALGDVCGEIVDGTPQPPHQYLGDMAGLMKSDQRFEQSPIHVTGTLHPLDDYQQ